MNVTQLTIEQLKALIEDTVETKLQELMGDPDAGLELREEVKERLRRSLAAEKRGQKHIPMEEVVRRLGLDS